MIVRNMPGGNATVGANYVYSSQPNGLTLMVASSSVGLGYLLRASAARYDLLKMPVILGTSAGGVFFIKPGIIGKPEDLLKAKGIVYGAATGGTAVLFACAQQLINIPTDRAILAYSSAGEALRAFLSGEVNASSGAIALYHETLVEYVRRGEIMIWFQTGVNDEKGNLGKDPSLPPDILTGGELYEKIYGKPPSGMAWNAYKGYVAVDYTYQKLLFLPPGTPDSIVRVYWDAAVNMLKDPEFQKAAARLVGQDAPWRAGEAYDKAFKRDAAMEPAVVDWLKSTLQTKYSYVLD
ncbi:MAG: hypothetical protein HYX90_07935 [Chloroflexi bacterium]|nr:hypothetical protein [Chloroflexota bacterium]